MSDEGRKVGKNLTNSEVAVADKGASTTMDAKKRKIGVVSGKPPGKSAAAKKRNTSKATKAVKPTRTLYNLINKGEFDEARKRLVSHPADSRYVGPDSRPTVLHLCVTNEGRGAADNRKVPTDLFASILAASPDALFRRSTMTKKCRFNCGGRTPLHLAASLGLAAEVGLLLDRCPPRRAWLSKTLRIPDDVAPIVLSFLPPSPALVKDDGNETPLHLAAFNARFDPDIVDIVEALVSRYPETGTMTADHDIHGRHITGYTPLHEVVSSCRWSNDRIVELLRVLIKHAPKALAMSCGDGEDDGYHGTPMQMILHVNNDSAPTEAKATILSETMKLKKEDMFLMLMKAYRQH